MCRCGRESLPAPDSVAIRQAVTLCVRSERRDSRAIARGPAANWRCAARLLGSLSGFRSRPCDSTLRWPSVSQCHQRLRRCQFISAPQVGDELTALFEATGHHQTSLARLGSVTELASPAQVARQVRLMDTRQASAPFGRLLVAIVEASIESTCHPSRKLALISSWVTRLGPQSPGWRSLKHSM